VSRRSPRQRKADERSIVRLDKRAVKISCTAKNYQKGPMVRDERSAVRTTPGRFHDPLRRQRGVGFGELVTRGTIDLGEIEEVIHHLGVV